MVEQQKRQIANLQAKARGEPPKRGSGGGGGGNRDGRPPKDTRKTKVNFAPTEDEYAKFKKMYAALNDGGAD